MTSYIDLKYGLLHEDTHATSHDELEDNTVPHPPSPKSIQLQELMAQVLLLQSQKLKLEQQKEKAEAEVAFLKAQPLYPDINQLTELLVTSLKHKLSKLLASHDFASSIPTELKELPSKITELSEEVKELNKQVREMEIELPKDLKDIPKKLFVTKPNLTVQEKSQDLDAFQVIKQGQLDLKQSKGKEVMSSKDAEDEETESDPENDHANPADYMVESSMKKKLKKFNFVTKGGEQIHLTAEKIEEQKRIEESLKAKLAKQEVEKVKDELVDLMGIDVVTRYYNKKLMYDKYCDKMMKRRKSSKIINYDVLTKKGPITLKVYREDGTNKVISNFKVSDLHLAEWREVVQACPNKKEKG
ncbi:hypothetical protein Tco_1214749 [Tanacetum coccineum]